MALQQASTISIKMALQQASTTVGGIDSAMGSQVDTPSIIYRLS
jgi:hypothetical protein